ncbi:MAG: hypothetical protein LQ338_002471 [Usnochroma carphineum]|nr:MAG: hypothetical protein LQ338_002471 [Usnochroma carphineum]
MPEHHEPSAAAPKAVKLRESCDSCLVAKVKCSKGRPLCSRCLQNGSECGYSPSSRAGRKNRDTANTKASVHKSHASLSSSNHPAPPSQFHPPMHRPPGTSEEAPSHKASGSSMNSSTTLVAMDDQGTQAPVPEKQLPMPPDGRDAATDDFLPTPPFNDFLDSFLPLSPEAVFAEFASAAPSPSTGAAQPSAIPAWTSSGNSSSTLPTFQSPLDMLSFGHFAHSQTNGRPSLPGHNELRQQPADAAINERPTCDCFAACLQALVSLHNHSWMASSAQQGGPPFDIVLSINREAIEGCAAMLSCSKCVAKIGSGISTMLLATIFGKVMSLYRAACFFRFGAASGMHATAQLAFGAYTVTGEDRQLLEIEMLLIELRKVENVLKAFQEKFDTSQAEKDETSVYNALTSYLEKNLYYIVEFLQARKGSLCK